MRIRQIPAIHPLFERGPVAESDAFHRPNPNDPFQLMGVKAGLNLRQIQPVAARRSVLTLGHLSAEISRLTRLIDIEILPTVEGGCDHRGGWPVVGSCRAAAVRLSGVIQCGNTVFLTMCEMTTLRPAVEGQIITNGSCDNPRRVNLFVGIETGFSNFAVRNKVFDL